MTIRVALRCDAMPSTGIGHAMRSMTLGHALVDAGAIVELHTSSLPDPLTARAATLGIAVVPIDDERWREAVNADVVVLDGYDLATTEAALAARGLPVTVIDDNGLLGNGGAALVLNQNLHADATLYPDAGPNTELLLGARYVLLRPEVAVRTASPGLPDPQRVLVCMGGSDPAALGLPIARALTAHFTEVLLAPGVAPSGATHRSGLAERITLEDGIRVGSLTRAGLGVIGAGTTLWEAAHIGLPVLALIYADNQAAAAHAAEAHGIARALDVRVAPDPAAIAEAAIALADNHEFLAAAHTNGPLLIDGAGAGRVAAAILALAGR